MVAVGVHVGVGVPVVDIGVPVMVATAVSVISAGGKVITAVGVPTAGVGVSVSPVGEGVGVTVPSGDSVPSRIGVEVLTGVLSLEPSGVLG